MTDKAVSPLRRRLIEDMAIRRLGPKTQLHYIRQVKRFADFRGQSADKATTEDAHRYQLWLASIGTTVPTVNVGAMALRVFFKITLKRRVSGRRSGVGPRAAAPRRRSQPGRGRSASRVDNEHQAQGGSEPDLCHRPAAIGGGIAQAHRHRQRPNGHPGRAGQGQEGPVCHSLAQPYLSCCATGGALRARRAGWLPVSPGSFPATAGST